MSEQAGAIPDLDLTALISSRICHDVISPVGAISNGLEVLSDETDEGMREQAMDLIMKSAQQASAKLQFARLAFGAAGSAGAEIDLRDAEKVANDFVQGKHSLTWKGPLLNMPKNKVKLLLNLIALGVTALPRGGTVDVEIDEQGNRFGVRSTGKAARLAEPVVAMLTGAPANGELPDAHSIQPYFARRIADAIGLTIAVEPSEDQVILKAG
ncbi:histidine phosphotransferase family protein [Methyloligella sp. 2.7D]|uniref:histidine phosphotransferase ChpT n=1 Tax=unclassified Methyloligella TaxID=2625955 RepID=UPI00157CBC26|nr:histidine phosphotransferase family protein [Methyloligella sp. GL2]QKP76919.1 histidine phosphotransferase [Methyloligella sp. GL2]